MARFEDYVKSTLDQEIETAAENSQERQDAYQLPDRFKGKSPEEIARSWEEAQSHITRQGSELGELRKQVTALTEALTKKPEDVQKPADKRPVTVDEIYENADGAVRRVVSEETQSRIEELERKLAEAEQRRQISEGMARFEAKFPKYKETLADSDFAEWVKKSQYRVALAQAGDAGNFDAADELFSLYAEIQAARNTEKETKRRSVKQAGLESSGGSAPATQESYSRHKLTEMRIRARRGDPEAERYLQSHGDSILAAYQEGRIVN